MSAGIYYIIYRAMDIWLGIWAVNYLFHTHIEYNFWNCLAFWVLVAIVDSDPLFKLERDRKEEVRKRYTSDW